MKEQTSNTAAGDAPTPAVRARLWCRAGAVGEGDGDPRLWLHLDDGRVLVVRWYRGRLGDDAVLAPLVAELADDMRGMKYQFELPGYGDVHVLYAAPVVPLPAGPDIRFPMHADYFAFTAQLDHEVLDFLARLENGNFFASVRNYNRLAALPAELREHRLQALRRFPALVTPLLLTAHRRPNVCDGRRHAWRSPSPEVEAAVDAGRDLVGALARRWGISRGLVRSPINATLWEPLVVVLPVLDALPDNKRPDAEALKRDEDLLRAYLCLFSDRDEDESDNENSVPRTAIAAAHAGAFRLGWDETWDYCRRHADNPRAALVDCKDFLFAAGRRAAELLKRRSPVPTHVLAMAWLAELGLTSLFAASDRWHRELPVLQEDALDFQLPAIVLMLAEENCMAREMLSARDLAREGEEMEHCVGTYWDVCLEGDRIFALRMSSGERATAHYEPFPHPEREDDYCYRLAQLRGVRNADPAPALEAFARRLERWLNEDSRQESRLAAMNAQDAYKAAYRAAAHLREEIKRSPPWPQDEKSERQLVAVMRRASLPPAGQEVLLRDWVAGYSYYDGEKLESQMQAGQILTLVREPENPHDELAIRIEWQGNKLGYVPRAVNEEIARMLDAAEPLRAHIASFAPNSPVWSRLEFIVEAATVAE